MWGVFSETKKIHNQEKDLVEDFIRSGTQELKGLNSRLTVLVANVDQLYDRVRGIQTMVEDHVNGEAEEVKDEVALLGKQIPPIDNVKDEAHVARTHAARVTISCPQKGDFAGKLVLLPHSFEKLLEIGKNKYCLLKAKVLTTNGAEIDCLDVIRDGDHLFFATSGSTKVASSLCSIL